MIVNAIIPDSTWDASTSNDIRPRTRRSPDAPTHLVGHTGRPANSSVQTRNHAKTKTALTNGEQHTAKPAIEQEPGKNRRQWERLCSRGKQTKDHVLVPRREGEGDREGNSFGNARRKETRNKDQSGGSQLTIETGSLFPIGPSFG